MTIPPFHLLVRKLAERAELSAADREALIALPATMRQVEPGAYLVREGEQVTHCSVLASGFAFRQKLTGAGARQILSIHIPGEALDIQHLTLDLADHNVQTLTRATVAIVPRKRLIDLAEARPRIGYALAVAAQVDASIEREWLLNIGRRNARERVAHLLCEVAVRLDALGLADEYGYELPMTQEQLGDAVGLTAVHVNRTLKALEADGLVKRRGRVISFPRWRELRDVGDFSSLYLHLARQSFAAAGAAVG